MSVLPVSSTQRFALYSCPAFRSVSVSNANSQLCFPARLRPVCIRYFNNSVQSALQATYLPWQARTEEYTCEMNLRSGPIVQYSGVTNSQHLTGKEQHCFLLDTSTVFWLYLWKVLDFYYEPYVDFHITKINFRQYLFFFF